MYIDLGMTVTKTLQCFNQRLLKITILKVNRKFILAITLSNHSIGHSILRDVRPSIKLLILSWYAVQVSLTDNCDLVSRINSGVDIHVNTRVEMCRGV